MTIEKMKITQSTYKKNQGLSLIEMMISMVLGLFLVLGLSTMYLSSKKTDKVRAAVSDIEETARLTLNSLRSAIEHAGYKSIDNIPFDKAIQTGAIANAFCRNGTSLVTNNRLTDSLPTDFTGYTADGDVDNFESDRITVVFRADNPDRGPIYFDCSGNAYAGNNATQIDCSTDPQLGMNNTWESLIYNGLYVDKSDKTLRCIGSRSANGSIILAENIENMQIRYGVTQGDLVTYKKASDVDNNKSEWESVTSIQLAILVGSERNVLDQSEAHSFELLDETISIDADRKIYRVFSTTVNLPNKNKRQMNKITNKDSQAPI